MAIRVGINGFGRIGRVVIRAAMEMPEIEIRAINLRNADLEYMVYMLRYDTVFGRFPKSLDHDQSGIYIDGKHVDVFSCSDALEIPWKEAGVDYVIDCTGAYVTTEKAMDHIEAGAKHVIISAPAKDKDTPTFVYGVNHDKLTKEDNIVSGASCTTNCLAPMAKALNDYREVRTGFMTTIHAYTGDQKILDSPHKKGNKRRARAGAVNIVPNSTGAAKAIGLVIPELDGKLIGSAQRVPVPSGSITILDATLKDETESVTVEGINEIMRKEANESFGYTEEEIVSSDIIGMSYGSLFDATQTLAQRCGTKIYEVRVVAWYDNEASYTSQLVRTLKHMGTLL